MNYPLFPLQARPKYDVNALSFSTCKEKRQVLKCLRECVLMLFLIPECWIGGEEAVALLHRRMRQFAPC